MKKTQKRAKIAQKYIKKRVLRGVNQNPLYSFLAQVQKIIFHISEVRNMYKPFLLGKGLKSWDEMKKKKLEVQDFFIGTYPLNAYPDPWDFVVDKYDTILKSIWRSQKRL